MQRKWEVLGPWNPYCEQGELVHSRTLCNCEGVQKSIVKELHVHIIVEYIMKVINFNSLTSISFQVFSVCIVNKIHNIETLYIIVLQYNKFH